MIDFKAWVFGKKSDSIQQDWLISLTKKLSVKQERECELKLENQ